MLLALALIGLGLVGIVVGVIRLRPRAEDVQELFTGRAETERTSPVEAGVLILALIALIGGVMLLAAGLLTFLLV